MLTACIAMELIKKSVVQWMKVGIVKHAQENVTGNSIIISTISSNTILKKLKEQIKISLNNTLSL